MAKMFSKLKDQITALAREEAEKKVAGVLKGVEKIAKALGRASKEIASFQKSMGRGGRVRRKVGRRRRKRAQRKIARKVRKAIKTGKVSITPAALKALRKKLKINQEELAKMLKVSPAAVRSWEQGRSQPRAEKLGRIAALRKKGVKKVKARVARPRKKRKIVRPKGKKKALSATPLVEASSEAKI